MSVNDNLQGLDSGQLATDPIGTANKFNALLRSVKNIRDSAISLILTTRGDLLTRNATTLVRLGIGSPNRVLRSDGTDPSWGQVQTADIADAAVTLAKMASGTAGNLITYDASGNPAAVATGSSTQVLTSNGAGAAPTFQTLSTEAIDVQTFTAGGTWTKSASVSGASRTLVMLWGAGGSGGKGAAAAGAGGGGGGGYIERWFNTSSLGATETVTLGTGGASQTTANTAGNVGGNSTFGSHLTAYGGGGGGTGGGGGGGGSLSVGTVGGVTNGGAGGRPIAGTAGSSGNDGGDSSEGGGGGGFGGATPTAGGWAHDGGGGGGGGDTGANTLGLGGNSVNGGAGGGGAGGATSGAAGGTSINGGAGGAGSFDSNNATAGSQPGGGGGGSELGNSGAGADGQCIVITFL